MVLGIDAKSAFEFKAKGQPIGRRDRGTRQDVFCHNSVRDMRRTILRHDIRSPLDEGIHMSRLPEAETVHSDQRRAAANRRCIVVGVFNFRVRTSL
jgi:hypothetical protein